MTVVPATISSEIVIKVDDLPPQVLEKIKSALTFENEERTKAATLRLHGWWDLPKTIAMWREEHRRSGDHVICLPRGFASQLTAGLTAVGASVQWDDRRTSALATPGYFVPFALYDDQVPFVASLMAAEQGIGFAPTGAGKTTCLLALMAYAQQRAIVITDKEYLVEQWRERAAQFLGLSLDFDDDHSVGKIGKGVWEERELTIALRQTLFSRLWETKATDWFSRVGVTILDESHHAGTAETLQEVVRDIPSRMLFGVSATPARTETQGKIISSLIGPIVAEISRDALYKSGRLMRPSLRIVSTDFKADFWPDHDSKLDGACQMPGCKKASRHSHRNNYTSVLKKLVESKERNDLIAEQIASERGHVHLVPSRRIKHLDAIRKAIERAGWDGPIFMLRGEENARGESQEIARQIAEAHEAVVLSTVADEGLDIPPIDRIHMVFPGRQAAATIQVIGRCERISEGKADAVVIEYHDPGCEVFNEQHGERMRTYRMQGMRKDNQELSKETIDFHAVVSRNEACYRCSCGAKWMCPHDDLQRQDGDLVECPECITRRPLKVLSTNGHVIDSFKGHHWFLSNFSDSTIQIDGIWYPTVEHAFQAQKTEDKNVRSMIASMPTPSQAKKAGGPSGIVRLRPGWDDMRNEVMRRCLKQKFAPGSELARRLLDTGDVELIEGNHWGDMYWGVYDGRGHNHLGRLLMEIRSSLREQETRAASAA